MRRYRLKIKWVERIKNQYTLTELSNILGFHDSTVSNILSGRYAPSRAFILNACFKFKLKPQDFLTEVRNAKTMDKTSKNK